MDALLKSLEAANKELNGARKHHATLEEAIKVLSDILKLAKKWKDTGARIGVVQFTGNVHGLFANELAAVVIKSKE